VRLIEVMSCYVWLGEVVSG